MTKEQASREWLELIIVGMELGELIGNFFQLSS